MATEPLAAPDHPAERRFKQLYFYLFAPFALQVTYTNLYLERRGLSHDEIGALSSLASLVAIASPLVWGPLADRLGDQRRVLVWLSLGFAITFPAMWFGHTATALLPIFVAIAICRAPLIPLSDAVCLDHLHRRGDRNATGYGRIRLWGSVGFIAAASLFPLILPAEATSDPLHRLLPVFVAAGLLSLVMAVRAATLPAPTADLTVELEVVTPPAVTAETPRPLGGNRITEVLRLPAVRTLLLITLVSSVSNAAYYLYLSLYLDAIGVPDRLKGIYWSVGVVAEVAMMAAAAPMLKRFGVRGVLLMGLFGRSVRLVAFGWALPPVLVLCLQPIHAFAFGAFHLASMAMLTRSVPSRLRATGQAVLSSLGAGLGTAAGNLLAGKVSTLATAGSLAWLTSASGLHAAFLVAGWIQIATLVITLIVLREPAAAEPDESQAAP